MISKRYKRPAAIVGTVVTAAVLVHWGYGGNVSSQPDVNQLATTGIIPLSSKPVATDVADIDVQYDLFLGSGFLIKDCGAEGVDIGDGIRRGEIIVRRKDVDLYVSRLTGDDRVICTHFFDETASANKAIRFADGSRVEYYEITGD